MQLKKIKLNNIRSYEDHEIEFPEGSTLLAGDIGSGKTSILLAIEFALFGLQPGQRGNALLRNSSAEGGASIEFEVDGKNVLIERTLKRGSKTISQDYAAITIDGEKTESSVTELKNKVLEILDYPKEFSKKQNILYKFTVYTPQEEMKQIILQDSETRLNTLRHVFGVDKYKRILENTSLLTAKLREEKRHKEGMISNLESDKANLEQKEKELSTKILDVEILEKELFLKTEARKQVQSDQAQVAKKREEKINLQQEIEKTKLMISAKSDSIFSNKKTIQQVQQQLAEIGDLTFDESQIQKLQEEILLLKNSKLELNEKNLEISSQISSLNLKNQDNDTLKSKLARMEICPTCLQDVDPVYKSNVANKLDSNTSENVKQINELTIQKQKLSSNLSKTEYEISLKENQIQELNLTKLKLQGIQEKKLRITELENSTLTLEKDIKLLTEQIEILNKSIFELAKYDSIFEQKQKELETAQTQEKLAEIKVAELKREIQVFSLQIEELKKRIEQTELIKTHLAYISSLENWLSKEFSPIIAHIEKNVMIKLRVEFSKLFAEWFAMLVPENFHVRLDDSFTPIIEQQDYELDYAYLSGGERTAIALAYRLSLNQVINSLLSKIKTRDLVILDEPTDGFSEQQLDKMRDVLQELNVSQLIIVSHEQKIEGFVENVVRLKKTNGVTKKE